MEEDDNRKWRKKEGSKKEIMRNYVQIVPCLAWNNLYRK